MVHSGRLLSAGRCSPLRWHHLHLPNRRAATKIIAGQQCDPVTEALLDATRSFQVTGGFLDRDDLRNLVADRRNETFVGIRRPPRYIVKDDRPATAGLSDCFKMSD